MSKHLRALIVEDSEDDAALVLRELKKAKYETRSERVETPGAFKGALSGGAWDVVISDYALPGFSGLAALELLKKTNHDIPFILISGAIDEEDAVAALKAGAHDFIKKGNLARLVPAIKREMRDAKTRRERKKALEDLRETADRLAHAQEIASMGSWEMDVATGKEQWSPEMYKIYGLGPDDFEPSYDNFYARVHPQDVERLKKAERDTLLNGKPLDINFRIIRPDGTVRDVYAQARVSKGSNGALERLTGITVDVTERKKTEGQLQLATRVLETSIEGLMITDRENRIQSVNSAFTQITGYAASEAIGNTPKILDSGKHDRDFFLSMQESVRNAGSWHGEVWNRRKDGHVVPMWVNISAVKDEYDDIVNYIGLFHDITDAKRHEQEIWYQAHYDALTGLPNRWLFRDRLNSAMARAKRWEDKLAVISIDIDNFKHINDSVGHAVGDIFIQGVAARLVGCFREEDTLARFGGDEFIVVLEEVKSEQDVMRVVNKIFNEFEEPFSYNGSDLYITTSVGAAVYPVDGTNADILIKNADTAMHRAKDQGKNSFSIYASSMNTSIFERLELESALRKAIEKEEFTVYYQPKIGILSGKITGAEALVRWARPGAGMVSPLEFIQCAEETGLIIPIGQWVLETACLQASKWHGMGHDDLSVSVNLSARQFAQKDLVKAIQSAIENAGLAPYHLDIEITESILMKDLDMALATMHALSGMGVNISLDDFGTGYSSLSYLKKFPINSLKIDKSFMMDVTSDPDNKAISTAIIRMGQELGLEVIAEGVEMEEQLTFLKDHDCDIAQGYYFSPPVSADKFVDLLDNPCPWK